MKERELIPKSLSRNDNKKNVLMTDNEIWFLKYLLKKYNPKKIVEIGVSAGGNTVNLLKWKNKNAQLFSIDIATQWHKDHTKLSGFMAEELGKNDNWKLYRGYDYLDVYEEIGNNIDFIIIDTTHILPGEILTFLAALPQLKDGCIVVIHDIHLNMLYFSGHKFYEKYFVDSYCTGLLFGSVSSNMKWSLKSDLISNIGAFVVDKSTKDNIKDIFHTLCATWFSYPRKLDGYSEFISKNYSEDCSNLFDTCLKLQSRYFKYKYYSQTARMDIINSNKSENAVEILNVSNSVDINFPNWFEREDGKGVVIQTKEKSLDLELKCINDGVLKISLKGPNVYDDFGKRIPVHINFNNFKVNNENIIDDETIVWHENPYVFEKDVKDGELIKIHVEFGTLI